MLNVHNKNIFESQSFEILQYWHFGLRLYNDVCLDNDDDR